MKNKITNPQFTFYSLDIEVKKFKSYNIFYFNRILTGLLALILGDSKTISPNFFRSILLIEVGGI